MTTVTTTLAVLILVLAAFFIWALTHVNSLDSEMWESSDEALPVARAWAVLSLTLREAGFRPQRKWP